MAFELPPELAASWREKGYFVLRGAASRRLVDNACEAIWSALGMRPDRPGDWYDERRRAAAGIDRRGMLPIYHDDALWQCRQIEQIYDAFCALYGDDDLRVSIDRVNMNPPVTAEWCYEGFLHWDIDVTRRPIAIQPQGLLALSSADADGGGFQCVAGFHNRIEQWLDARPAGYSTRFPDVSEMRVDSVPLQAGDFLVWQGALPHGNAPNRASRPRLAQYITMKPAREISAEMQRRRVDSLLRGAAPIAPNGTHLPADPRGLRPHPSLTPLGRRLLGLAGDSPAGGEG